MASPLDLETPLTPATTPPPEGPGTPVTPHVDAEPDALVKPEVEPTPERIGRFRVLKRLGSGGMGVVYVAYDEELGRKIALKVLRTAATSPHKRDKARSRLTREAQAMAKLSHPNVIAIYDVGAVGDQVFLAMEYVKGATLTKWLRAAEGAHGPRRRTWQEVLVVFVQAGRGLAAAHHAGIIHRDFKPDNVLIDAEGRVRVGDFGLARADGGLGPLERPDTFNEAIRSMSDKSMLDIRITRTGGMTGTPAYMAPEQYLGHATDARTDQFSFCVALYEGLYGQRPFLGERVALVREAVIAGRVQDVPPGNDVPLWLRKLVLRGLSVRPEARFRSMDELLARLTEAPRPRLRRRHLLAALGALVALGAAGVGIYDYLASAPPELPRCDAPEVPWDEARRAALVRVLGEGPDDTRPAAALAALDAYAEDLRRGFQDLCARSQAATPAEGAAACLERRRSAFAGLTRALADAGEARARALTLVDDLPPLRECDDPRRVRAEAPVPADPATRTLREGLDHARALLALGDVTRAADLAAPQLAAAEQQDALPLRAEALLLRGAIARAQGRVGAAKAALEQALWAAEACRHDPVAVDALDHLLDLESEDLARHDEARRLWGRLSAAMLRLGDEGPRELAARVRHGRALLREGATDEAREQLAAALRRAEALFGADDRRLVAPLVDLALASQRAGRGDEAAQQLARAEAIAHAALPPEHPERARLQVAAGDLARERGDLPGAVLRYDAAMSTWTGLYGHDHVDMSPALLGRSLAAAARHDWATAAADLRRALTLLEAVYGGEGPRLIEALTALCVAESARGEHATALAACRRATNIASRVGSPAQLGVARFALARALWADAEARGEAGAEGRAQARTTAQQALDEGRAVLDPPLIAALTEWLAARAPRGP